jgi:hypothetical protein
MYLRKDILTTYVLEKAFKMTDTFNSRTEYGMAK